MSYLMDDNPGDPVYSNPYDHHSPLPTPPPAPAYTTQPVVLPKVGQTRCYWALLTSDLQFIYLDPVLNYHLGEQAELLVGKSLLSFVHPDEQAFAKRDLGNALESKTLLGSVTRVRYSRLSSIRRQLGYEGPGPDWIDADKISLDRDYLAADLVINWAADGLVLCFIHAIVDLNSVADNDELNKTHWTNWCGTPWMPREQIETLYRRFLMCSPQTGTMSRVFQILLNQGDRPLVLSWPPDSGHGPSSRDFAKIVENVQNSAGEPGGSDAKTSCTRRHKTTQDMHSVFGCQVESIFIPHGTIIFACHRVNPTSRTSTAMNQVNYAPAHYAPYYDQSAYNNLPSLSHEVAYSNGFTSHAAYSPQRWPSASMTPSVQNLRSDPYATTSPPWSSASPSSSTTPTSTTYLSSDPPQGQASAPSFDQPLSPPSYTRYAHVNGNSTAASLPAPAVSPSGPGVVPPSRRRVSPGSARDHPVTGHGAGPVRSCAVGSTSTIGVSRPTGILKCSSCKTTSSPEWRKGPSGKKELCNACGLRYARSRAKKEGPLAAPSRKRKEKGIVKRESATPPSSASSYSTTTTATAARRTFASSNVGGSDLYGAAPHPHHHLLDNHFTPSPSPPAVTGVGFGHYGTASGHGSSHDNNNRPPPYSHSSNSFYSTPIPSPLSIVHTPQQQNQASSQPTPSSSVNPQHHQRHLLQQHPRSQQHLHSHTQLPPLDQIKTAIPSSMPPSSYSHDREVRGQQHQSHQQQSQQLTPLSTGDVREGYRRSI